MPRSCPPGPGSSGLSLTAMMAGQEGKPPTLQKQLTTPPSPSHSHGSHQGEGRLRRGLRLMGPQDPFCCCTCSPGPGHVERTLPGTLLPSPLPNPGGSHRPACSPKGPGACSTLKRTHQETPVPREPAHCALVCPSVQWDCAICEAHSPGCPGTGWLVSLGPLEALGGRARGKAAEPPGQRSGKAEGWIPISQTPHPPP